MKELKPRFRLRCLFSPAYLAARLVEIRSFSDAFRRASKVPVYVYYLAVNGGYSVIGLALSLVRRLDPAHQNLLARTGKGVRLVLKSPFAPGNWLRDLALRKALRSLRPAPPGIKMDADIPPPAGMNPDRPMRALWFIHPACNYHCAYCWQAHSAQAPVPPRGAEEYARCWESFNRVYGPAAIEIIGGEPFILPGFPEILLALSRENSVSVITNLSWNPDRLIGKLKPGRVSLLASYHPDQDPRFERFVEKADKLRRAGFPVTVCLVAFPPDLPRLPAWLDALYQKGIFAIVLPFKGKWHLRSYPRAHTALEKEFIRGANQLRYMFPSSPKTWNSARSLSLATNFQLSGVSPRGKLCNTGLNYCRILLNGDIVRCGECKGMAGTDTEDEVLGNLYKGVFHLADKAEPCLFDGCECLGENYYMAGGALGPVKTNEHVHL